MNDSLSSLSERTMADQLVPAAEPIPILTTWITGLRHTLRYWPVLAWMLLGTLLPALLAAFIPVTELFRLAHNPVIERMAAGIPAWLLVDIAGLSIGGTPQSYSQPVSNAMFWLVIGFLVMPLLGGLVSAFLYGGVLLTYREAPERFNLRRFLWGCWHWFGAYLALGFIQVALFFVILLPVTGLLSLLGAFGSPGWIAALVLIALLWVVWLMIFELARVRLILANTRNPFRGLGQAFRWLFRCPLALFGFYGLSLLLLLAVHALFRLVINPNVPLDALVPALVVQQGFILARLLSRALRLAGLAQMASAEA